jgi:hypothetical protein
MFEKNMLTFNPGCDQNAENVGEFTDVRELQKQLEASAVTIVTGVDDSAEGPRQHSARRPRWKSDPDRPAPLETNN